MGQQDIKTNGNYNTPYDIDIYALSGSKLEDYIFAVVQLPEVLGHILTDFSTAEFIEDSLAPQFQLSAPQKADITRIIRDVLLNDLSIGDMVNTIASKLQVDPQKAKDIANQIVSQLFAPVTGDLQQLQKQKFGDRTGGNPEVEPRVTSPQPETSYQKPITSPPLPPGSSFHDQNMAQKDILETGGNVLDLRQK